MRRPIFAHDSGAIHREDDREMLNCDIVNDVVVRALQERRVDRANGLHPRVARPAANVTACPSAIPTSKKRSGCAFANTPVPVPLGIAAVMATSFSFSSASSASPFPNTAVYAAFAEETFSCFPVAGSCPGGSACHFSVCSPAGNPLPFCVMHVNESRPAQVAHRSESVHQHVDVVSVDRAEVPEAELLEQNARSEERLDALLPLSYQRSDAWRAAPERRPTTDPIAERTRLYSGLR